MDLLRAAALVLMLIFMLGGVLLLRERERAGAALTQLGSLISQGRLPDVRGHRTVVQVGIIWIFIGVFGAGYLLFA